MAQLLQPFDATQVKPNEGVSNLPVGIHDVVITASEVKSNKSGTGGYLRLTLEIAEGVLKGKTGAMNINLYSQNEKAVEIAKRTLSTICHATGVLMLQDSAQLHNQIIRVEVELQSGEGGEKGYTEVKRVFLKRDEPIQPTEQPAAAPAWGQQTEQPAAAPGWDQPTELPAWDQWDQQTEQPASAPWMK